MQSRTAWLAALSLNIAVSAMVAVGFWFDSEGHRPAASLAASGLSLLLAMCFGYAVAETTSRGAED
jgi:hypothetical protein